MAPARKRPAGAFGKKPSKRSSRDPVIKKCNVVADAVRESDELPENVVEMLAEMAPYSLSVLAKDRHPAQVKTVEMLEEAIMGIETKLKVAVAEAQVKVDSADVEKNTRGTAVTTAETHLKDCEEKCIKARETCDMDEAALKTARADAATATSAEAKTLEDLAEKEESKVTLAAAAEAFKAALGDKLTGKAYAPIGSALAEICSKEASFVHALQETLKRESESRGSFDKLVIDQASAAFVEVAAQLQESLLVSEATKAEAAAVTEAAKVAVAAAAERSAASSTALGTAVGNARDAEEILKTNKEAVEAFSEEVQEAGANLDHAKGQLAIFQDGPLAAFMELKVLAAPAPKEVCAEVEAPAEVEPEQAPALEQAMQAAPAVQAAPSMLPSPRIAVGRAMEAVAGLVGSPRISPSPQIS